MVYERNLQAIHFRQESVWTGRWFLPKGDRGWGEDV
jgi:hypothetical protein